MTYALADAARSYQLVEDELREQIRLRVEAERRASAAGHMEAAAKLAAAALLERLQRLEAVAEELCADVHAAGELDGRRLRLLCNVRRAVLGV